MKIKHCADILKVVTYFEILQRNILQTKVAQKIFKVMSVSKKYKILHCLDNFGNLICSVMNALQNCTRPLTSA